MPATRRRAIGAVLSALLLAGMAFVALSPAPAEQPEVAAASAQPDLPALQISYGRQQLQLSMTAASAEHEAAMLRLIGERFAGEQTRVDFEKVLLAESAWPVVTTSLIDLVSATRSATASADHTTLTVRAVADDTDQFAQRLADLRSSLPTEMKLDIQALDAPAAMDTASLCARSFAPISEQTIHFRQTSIQIRESFYPLLDRLVEFAYNCRDATIAVIGHTDSTGAESWNKQVSLARAQAVADYVTSKGIAPDQLLVEGAGSANPIGDNDTVAGRERNRRIEFELR